MVPAATATAAVVAAVVDNKRSMIPSTSKCILVLVAVVVVVDSGRLGDSCSGSTSTGTNSKSVNPDILTNAIYILMFLSRNARNRCSTSNTSSKAHMMLGVAARATKDTMNRTGGPVDQHR